MKILITCLFFLSAQIFAQTYLEVTYSNEDPANSTDLSLLQKITFSTTDVTFLLTDNSSVVKSLSTLDKITFSGTDGGSPLPVELTNFSAAINGKNIILQWSTATEVNNYGFEIERTSPQPSPLQGEGGEAGRGWEKIGFVKGHGSSNSQNSYSFTDAKIKSTKLQYRLKQIDTDGDFQYSEIVEVDLEIPVEFALNQNYPNPFNPSTIISYSLPVDGFVMLKIYDASGGEVASLINENKKAGNYSVVFNGSRLSSGIYFAKMIYADYSGSIKMLMLK